MSRTITERARATRRHVRRNGRVLALALLLAAGTAYAVTADGGPVIPVPDPLVDVRTESGTVVRERVIPLGGVPVPIDVDERLLLGTLFPDVDVSVGLVAADELPERPIVPTIKIDRDPTAILRTAPAPPLRIDLTIRLKDAGNGLRDLATIRYGYETTAGGLVPARFTSKLVGPIDGGFVDPLDAIVHTPGYAAPLKLNADVQTDAFDGAFEVAANPLPERIRFVEDPRGDGLDFSYDHDASVPDVKLDMTADLRDPDSGRRRHVDATVERVPRRIELHNTNSDERSAFEYETTSPLGKPDIEAGYRDSEDDGTIVADANVKVAGLPARMTGDVGFVPAPDGGSAVDSLDFRVLDGEEIESIDFLARNFVGDPGPVPEPALGPDQFVAFATRQMPDATRRFRAAGRVQGVRSVRFERQGADDETVDVTTDLGDGNTPLRAIVDLDNRGPGGPSDDADRRRLKVDTTITPLPRNLHVTYDPAKGADPTRLVYDSGQTVDVDTVALIADGDDADGCGEHEVTCLKARIDKLPGHLEAALPGAEGTDFAISHDGAQATRPDVRATVDRTTGDGGPDDPSERTYAEVGLLRVPGEVSGRLDSRDGVVRAAEFHACDFDFAAAACRDTLASLGRVTFTVRDRPDRSGLPPRPDTTPMFMTLLERGRSAGAKLEATGRVDEVQQVAFHQRDEDGDGEADGTLGARVNLARGEEPFQVVVDSVAADEGVPAEDASTRVDVKVDALPDTFSACVRSQEDVAPPEPGSLPADPLLAECDRIDVLGYGPGRPKGQLADLDVTPLSAVYRATNAAGAPHPTKVTTRVTSEAPDPEDGNRRHVDDLAATIAKVPGELRVDVIPPVSPQGTVPSRKLELAYDASQKIDQIDFDFASRRSNSFCADPRPNRLATCASARLKNLPDTVEAVYDPDERVADVELRAPAAGGERLSIGETELSLNHPDQVPLHVSSVEPDPNRPDDPAKASRLVFDATVKDMNDRLVGKLQRLNLDPEGDVAPLPDGDPVAFADQIATCDNGVDEDGDGKQDAQDPDCEADMARVRFDACPGVAPAQLATCDGIGRIDFRVQNSLVGDPFETVAIPPVAGVTQDVSFLQQGDDFRARGVIGNFKQIEMSQIGSDEQLSPTTKLRAAFGSGAASEKIRAYIDRNTGSEGQLIDAVIGQAPQAVNLCFRDQVNPADVRTGGQFNFCEVAPKDKLAVQTALDAAAGAEKPDIAVRRFKLSKGGGAEVLTGPAPGGDSAIAVDDLGERIDVLAGKGDDTEIEVVGRAIGDPVTAAPKQVAGRVSFDLQNFEGAGGTSFPYRPLDAGVPEPEDDGRNVSGGRHNFLKVVKNRDALRLKGSVPDVRRIALRPAACQDDPRYPDPSAFTAAERPEYTCVQALAAQGRPLGVAVRTLDAANDIVSIDDAVIDSLPAGSKDGVPDGLSATIGKAPDSISAAPVCGSPGASIPCRPPLLSVTSPKAAGQQSNLSGRLAFGPLALAGDELRDVVPFDPISQRLDYEQRPQDYAFRGARVKVGDYEPDKAIRAGLNLRLPNFLDLDPPTVYTCEHEQLAQACGTGTVDKTKNKGFSTKDIALKLVAADDRRDGSDVASLGRVAVIVDKPASGEKGASQIVITGTPDGAGDEDGDGRVPFDPENPPPQGLSSTNPERRYDLGADLPGHLDLEVFMRDKFHSPDDDTKQIKFVQVDGRVNRELSMGVRLNEKDQKGNLTGTTQSRERVAGTQLALRHAPGVANPAAPDYTNPTFRMRAEIVAPHHDPGDIEDFVDVLKFVFTCDGAGIGIDIVIAHVCFVLPDPETRWLEANLNFDPPGPQGPARTVEAVVDTEDTNVDLVGFESSAFSTHADKTALAKANFTPEAGLRLQPFDIGLSAGVNLLGLASVEATIKLAGDLVVGVAGRRNQRTRLSQELQAVRLKSSGGAARVSTKLLGSGQIQLKEEALFGLVGDTQTLDFGRSRFPVNLINCPLGGDTFDDTAILGINGFEVSNNNVKTTVGVAPNATISGVFTAPFTLLSEVLSPFSCFASAEDGDRVRSGHPAPAYEETSPPRPIPDAAVTPPVDGGPTPPAPQPRPDVTVASTQTHCGTLNADTLTVTGSGRIVVGKPGEFVEVLVTNASTGETQKQRIDCDGRLSINARVVEVQAGGRIDASATLTAAGPGTPASGTGGAGHHSAGGTSDGGGAGGSSYAASDGPLNDFGSRGGGGASAGGAGGGVVAITADDRISVSGTVSANGGPGAGSGGGGGSGGAIQLKTKRLSVGGDVQVVGGPGGGGGGGGAGGRITIFDVVHNAPLTTLDVFGGAGGGGAATSGGSGSRTITTLARAAGVTRVSNDPAFVQGSVDLRLEAMQPGGGPLRIILCRRSVGPTHPDPFGSGELDPVGNASPEQVMSGASCTSESFSAPTESDGITYRRDVTRSSLADGYHGFYAFAAKPPPSGPDLTNGCLSAPSPGPIPPPLPCTFQSPLPGNATATLGSDTTKPTLATFDQLNGQAGCPSAGSRCLGSESDGKLRVDVNDGSGPAGVARVVCSVGGGPFDIPCGPGEPISVPLGDTQGQRTVDVKVIDRAGNERVSSEVGKTATWFRDSRRPAKPVVTVTPQGDANNGWRTQKPLVSVDASDPAPSSGFAADPKPISVHIDEAEVPCGGPDASGASCSSDELKSAIPADGKHTVTARATDRVGNTSEPAAPQTFRIDSIAPRSRLFLGSRLPDGKDGFYVTNPFFAFAASDQAGGSGVDLAVAPSKIRFRIDGGAWTTWDPADDLGNRIPQGIHTICFYAVDVAGNKESDVEEPGPTTRPPNCRSDIKVDATAPTVAAPISPPTPDGDNSFYRARPQVDPQGTDPVPAGVPASDVSGLDRVEVQVDTGAWQPAAPFAVDEGEHVVRVRAFDRAGNAAEIVERTVRVDASPPAARIGSYPPRPNDQGWFRQDRIDAVAVSDGRDGSGADGAKYTIDGGAPVSYLGPFAVGHGTHDVTVRARDRAGLLGDPVKQSSQVDMLAPVPLVADPPPQAILLPGGESTLRFDVAGTPAPRVKVVLWIYDALGSPVHRLVVPGTHAGGFRDAGPGSVRWDGRDERGRAVLPGPYHYRVQAIDQAGNAAISSESRGFLVGLAGSP